MFVSGCTEGGNPDKKCPESLAELGQYTSDKDTKDVWGNELVMLCGESAPAEARGFGVLSMGADGKLDTADDIKSWGPRP